MSNAIAIRRVASAALSLSAVKALEYLVPLIALPYLLRTIGLEGFGVIALATAFALYFAAFVQYGFGVTATRAVARASGDRSACATIFWSTTLTSFVLCTAAVGLHQLIVSAVDAFAGERLVFTAALATVMAHALTPQWWFQGIGRLRSYAAIATVSKVVYLLGLFSLVQTADDYRTAAVVAAVTSIAGCLIALSIARPGLPPNGLLKALRTVPETLKAGRFAFISQFAPTLYNNSATFLLGISESAVITGAFSAATKVVDAVASAAYVVASAAFPTLSRDLRLHAPFAKLMIGAGALLSIALALSAATIALLLSPRDPATLSEMLWLLSPAVLFLFLILTFNTNYLMLVGYDRGVGRTSLVISVGFFVFACAAIPASGVWGALATLVGARAVMAAVAALSYLRHRRADKSRCTP
jgi:PST family polysaccharide transporter